MKPRAFEYLVPRTLGEAADALAEHGDAASVLAGGQSLLAMMNLRIASPAVLVDIMRIPELRRIERLAGWIEIGAGIRMTHAERNSGHALLARALHHVGHTAIRNAGTVCGSVAHADPAAEIPGVLLALDGEVVLESRRGRRVLAAEDFFQSYFQTSRSADELVTAVRLPESPSRIAFHEVTPRLGGSTGEFAIAAVAATAVSGEDGRWQQASIALIGAAERPVRARAAEALLTDAVPTPERLDAAAEAAVADLDPHADVHAQPPYRRRVVRVLVRRALEELAR